MLPSGHLETPRAFGCKKYLSNFIILVLRKTISQSWQSQQDMPISLVENTVASSDNY